jgi:holo-[acyl-carrier protein] synthase
MIYGFGLDIVEVARIQTAIEKYGDRFRNKLFTIHEIEYCESFKDKQYVHYAARFAAKEAFSKAIGTGITQGFNFKDIAVANEQSGKPYLVLDGLMKERYGEKKSHITLSHTDNNAVAAVILED